MADVTADEVLQIERAHKAARPNPRENPAWANAERDIGVLLQYIRQLESERDYMKTHAAWAQRKLDRANQTLAKVGTKPVEPAKPRYDEVYHEGVKWLDENG